MTLHEIHHSCQILTRIIVCYTQWYLILYFIQTCIKVTYSISRSFNIYYASIMPITFSFISPCYRCKSKWISNCYREIVRLDSRVLFTVAYKQKRGLSSRSRKERVLKSRKRSKSHFSPPLYPNKNCYREIVGLDFRVFYLIALIEKGFEVKFINKTSVKVANLTANPFFRRHCTPRTKWNFNCYREIVRLDSRVFYPIAY